MPMTADEAMTWAIRRGLLNLIERLRGYAVTDFPPYSGMVGKHQPDRAERQYNEYKSGRLANAAECNGFAELVFARLSGKLGENDGAAPRVERVASKLEPYGAHNFVLLNRQPGPGVVSRFRRVDLASAEFRHCIVVDAWEAAMGHDTDHAVRRMHPTKGTRWGWEIEITGSWNPTLGASWVRATP